MTYDNELTLIRRAWKYKNGKPVVDEDGNAVYEEKRAVVLCSKKSATRYERQIAAVNDIRPAFVFVVHQYEYQGEVLVEFEERRYEVYETYEVGIEEVELKTREVIGSAQKN